MADVVTLRTGSGILKTVDFSGKRLAVKNDE